MMETDVLLLSTKIHGKNDFTQNTGPSFAKGIARWSPDPGSPTVP